MSGGNEWTARPGNIHHQLVVAFSPSRLPAAVSSSDPGADRTSSIATARARRAATRAGDHRSSAHVSRAAGDDDYLRVNQLLERRHSGHRQHPVVGPELTTLGADEHDMSIRKARENFVGTDGVR